MSNIHIDPTLSLGIRRQKVKEGKKTFFMSDRQDYICHGIFGGSRGIQS
jgi:hypothetical protein